MAQHELQVRLPITESVRFDIDSILDELTKRLTAPGEFHDGEEEEDGEICFYLFGLDPKRLRDVARTTLAKFDLLSGAYTVEVRPGHEGAEPGPQVPF